MLNCHGDAKHGNAPEERDKRPGQKAVYRGRQRSAEVSNRNGVLPVMKVQLNCLV